MNKIVQAYIVLITLSLLFIFKDTYTENTQKIKSIDKAFEQDRFLTADKITGKKEVSRLIPILDAIEENVSNRNTTSSINWESRGPLKVAGRTRALMFDPNDNNYKKVWAGGVNGGIWYNNDYTDEEEVWHQVATTMENYAVTCLSFDPNNTQTFYAGTGEAYGNLDAALGGGIWKSTDSGITWTRLSSTSNGYITDIVVKNNGGNSEVYYASRDTPGGLYKSIDGGNSFNQVFTTDVANIEIDNNNTLWISTFNGKIYNSNNNGGSFNQKYSDSSTQRTEIACAASNADYIYAVQIRNGALDKILLTTDGGSSWTEINKPQDINAYVPNDDFTNGQGWYDLIVRVDPTDETKFYLGGLNAFISVDSGNSYMQLSDSNGDNGLDYMHADQHNFLFNPLNTNDGVASNDGGVFYLHNIVQTFVNPREVYARNLNYNVTQFYSCAISPTSTNLFLAGAQDNGTQKFDDIGIDDTDEISGGDGAFCFIDQSNGDYKIYSYLYNNYYLKGNVGTYTLLNDSSSGFFINRADYDDYKNILYSSKITNKLYRVKIAADNSSSFTSNVDEITINGLSDKATHIRVSPYTLSASKLYVGDSSGHVIRVDDASIDTNPSTTTISAGITATGSVSCIEFGNNEDEIIVTFSNYGEISVWSTVDGGNTWQNKEGNLPDMPIRWAFSNPLNRDEVLLATELGIWSTQNFYDTNPIWSYQSSNIGATRVDMLQYRASDNTLIAATHGRGLFSTQSLTSLGTSDIELTNKEILIFPNPASSYVSIQSDISIDDATIFIVNSTGAIMHKEKRNITENQKINLNISFLKNDIYFITIKNNKLAYHSRLLINN